jgi:hypothetical protein
MNKMLPKMNQPIAAEAVDTPRGVAANNTRQTVGYGRDGRKKILGRGVFLGGGLWLACAVQFPWASIYCSILAVVADPRPSELRAQALPGWEAWICRLCWYCLGAFPSLIGLVLSALSFRLPRSKIGAISWGIRTSVCAGFAVLTLAGWFAPVDYYDRVFQWVLRTVF